jgi:hypothetical protein
MTHVHAAHLVMASQFKGTMPCTCSGLTSQLIMENLFIGTVSCACWRLNSQLSQSWKDSLKGQCHVHAGG